MDVELDYAQRLGDVLRDMRRDLTDDASERVLLWSLERWGVHVSTLLILKPVPAVRRPSPAPAPAESIARPTLPNEPEENSSKTDLICHVCGKVCVDRRGLSGHLRIVHKIRLADVARA